MKTQTPTAEAPLVVSLTLTGLAREAFLAMCKNDECPPPEWLKEMIGDNLAEFFEFNSRHENGRQLTDLFNMEIKA